MQMEQTEQTKQFRILKPKVLKQILTNAKSPGITSIFLCSIDGSIISKVGAEDNIHSQAAVLTNICSEYIEFGHEAFKNNSF
jgi:hypothetical protein